MTESTETENMHTCNVFVCVGACGCGCGCGCVWVWVRVVMEAGVGGVWVGMWMCVWMVCGWMWYLDRGKHPGRQAHRQAERHNYCYT